MLLGSRPYGYSTFEYDLTPHLHLGDTPNVLAVRVDRSIVADSRWYPGSGIYRHVWLNVTAPVHIGPWEPYITTPLAGDAEALVSIETRVVNESPVEARTTCVTSILNEKAEEVASVKAEQPVAAATGPRLRPAGRRSPPQPLVARTTSPVHCGQPRFISMGK